MNLGATRPPEHSHGNGTRTERPAVPRPEEETLDIWIIAAAGSALFAGLTSILSKCGMRTVDSDLATALRTTVVLVFAWLMAGITVPHLPSALAAISSRSYLFLALSGAATGASWICYFKALAEGDVNKVVPIDKSSSALSALLAIALFGETGYLGVKLAGTAVIFAGTLLMVERRHDDAAAATASRTWLVYAVLSAIFAALTSVLAKVGIQGVDSNLATALRTCVVLALAWGIAACRGKLAGLRHIAANEVGFLVVSGLATGASWLCYYYAVQIGQVSVVVQIDKLSILVSIAFSRLAFGERLNKMAAIGLALIVAGTLAMTAWS